MELIRELFRYQTWADEQIVAAVKAHESATADERLRKTLHHIVVVQRYYLARCAGQEFEVQREMRVPESMDEMEKLFRDTHDAWTAVLETLDAAEFAREIDLRSAEFRPTVREALVQVVLHSQHHRGQLATRLRELGAVPPTVDYLLMPKGR